MGPSGAGKSTLFNVLLGRTPIRGGEILVNGKNTKLSKFVANIGFVPQDDVMIRELTVR